MTKLHYPQGCVAGSEDHGIASPSGYAWNVNVNNGNSNWNNQNNNGFVRAVRASECQGAVTLRDLHAAWRAARRAKRPSANQLSFDTHWLDGLLRLQDQLNACTWRPSPPTCFVAEQPKAREIHAPDFADRVVHHWLVPKLEAIYERAFIHDSFSNREGKGTHAAVDRLQSFVRQVHSGEGGGWYLQLDIHNFFNSIHRPTLWTILKARLQRHGLPTVVQRATHALLRYSPTEHGVHYRCTSEERAQVPAHKQLANAAPGCGIAIGNLSSQFFANVYLDQLDQFMKHELKVQRYVRYVDDFVLVHHSREQLAEWKVRIELFLKERLRLSLKDDVKLRPLSCGIDFLGYVIFPTHRLVRRRVVQHARAKLGEWQQRHVQALRLRATPVQFRQIQSIWKSYEGHFGRANARRLFAAFHRRFPWLAAVVVRRSFDYRLDGKVISIRRSRR